MVMYVPECRISTTRNAQTWPVTVLNGTHAWPAVSPNIDQAWAVTPSDDAYVWPVASPNDAQSLSRRTRDVSE